MARAIVAAALLLAPRPAGSLPYPGDDQVWRAPVAPGYGAAGWPPAAPAPGPEQWEMRKAALHEMNHSYDLTNAADIPAWPLDCNYAVQLQPTKTVAGEVPGWLDGSYYHSVFTNIIIGPYGANVGFGTGAVVSVHFRPGQPVTASFGFAKGSDWHRACKGDRPNPYVSGGVVTLKGVVGPGTLLTTSGSDSTILMDAMTLDVLEAPTKFTGSLGERQNEGYNPDFYATEHLATDQNGDVYAVVYIYDPKPCYRIFKVRANTRDREHVADVEAHKMFGGKKMAFLHQGVGLTESYILLPEMPVAMSRKGTFDTTEIANDAIPNGKMFIHVLDKATGQHLKRYYTDQVKFTWHHINAWENATHLNLDITWEPTADAAMKSFTHILKSKPYDWGGRLARLAMPNPAAPTAMSLTSRMDLRFLSPLDVGSTDFAVVNPAHRWRSPCRYIWAAATGNKPREEQPAYWTELIRVDTWAEDGAVKRYSKPGWQMNEPLFVQKDPQQSADSSEGVIVAMIVSWWGRTSMALLDASTMEEIAMLGLPIDNLQQNSGAHNYWTSSGSSLSTLQSFAA